MLSQLGETLRCLFWRRKLSAADVVVMGADIAEALLHVHLRGLAHKDVKPQNILLGRDQQGRLRAKLCDFDLAQALAQTRAAAGRCE
jgi:serine/threonine protein kinase